VKRRRASRSLISASALALLSVSGLASAQQITEQETTSSSWSAAAKQAADDGAFLPLALAPTVGPQTARALALGGYNGAEHAAAMRSFAEARAYGPFALQVGVRLNELGKEVGPSLGVRAQLLAQDRHGVNGGVALFYKAEGFDEPEGEVELVLSLSRRYQRWLFVGSVAYGQDPEGHERDAEVALATLYQLTDQLHWGLDSRARFDLGSQRAKLQASREPRFDLDAGPVVMWLLGPVALSAHAGAAVIRFDGEPTQAGLLALAGLGTAF
jgi:hypothetical protein